MESILILGSMHDFEEITKTCIKNGYYTIVCDQYKDGPAKKIAHKSYDVNVFNIEEMESICLKHSVKGVITGFSDVLMEAYVPLCNKLRLNCYLSDKTLNIMRNKVEMKEALNQYVIKTARYTTLSRGFEEKDIKGFNFPMVIKPIDGYGSRGVFKVWNADEIRNFFSSVLLYSQKSEVLLEEFCKGDEYSFLSWVVGGRGKLLYIGKREKFIFSNNEAALPCRFIYPPSNYWEIVNGVQQMMNKIIEAYDIKNGPLAAQFFYDGNEIILGEATARLFGDGDHRVAFYSQSLKVEEMLIDYAMSNYDEKRITSRLDGYESCFPNIIVQLQIYGTEGEISKIKGIDQIKNIKGFKHIELYYEEGQIISIRGVNRATIGMLFFSILNYYEIDEKINECLEVLKVLDNKGNNMIYKIDMNAVS